MKYFVSARVRGDPIRKLVNMPSTKAIAIKRANVLRRDMKMASKFNKWATYIKVEKVRK